MQKMAAHYIWKDNSWAFSWTEQRSKFLDQKYILHVEHYKDKPTPKHTVWNCRI